jgi:outer membrane biosynthesis protein TonB
MDPAVFSYVYRHFRSQIAACHSAATRSGAEVAGTMRVRVRLGTDGHVARTRVVSNTTGSEDLARCVEEDVRRWTYPRPEGGEVEFEYNFAFGS